MTVKEYIDSGILESYVLGATSDDETRELLQLKKQYPEIEDALYQLEVDMERIAGHMAITPPPHLWKRVEEEVDKEVMLRDMPSPEVKDFRTRDYGIHDNKYIEVESESTHMKVHKAWKWVFAAVFVLGKIFLGFAIYFYLENRQAQEQILELKTQLHQLPVK